MAQVTRLGLHGGPRGLYGNFRFKTFTPGRGSSSRMNRKYSRTGSIGNRPRRSFL